MGTAPQLNNLIGDIYSYINNLSEGKDLNISEDLIEDFGERIKDSIRNWSTPKKQSTGLRMSNIGRPARQLWYDQKDKPDIKLMPSTQIKFLYGHLLEEVIILLVKLAGHTVSDEQKEVSVDGIKGHIDCKINGEVIDIKTASGRAFSKFSQGTLSEDDPFGYMAQLSGYEESEGTDSGGFLAINKESGELALHIPEELDKINIKQKISDTKESLLIDTPPPKCYSDVPEGKSGNLKLNKNCNYCAHKFKCWSDSNDGQGLRKFMYSKGPVYFTRVVKMPRVQEAI